MGIWQDLVDVHGFPGGYQSVKRYVRKLRGTGSGEARPSSRPSQVKSARWTTGLVPWCAIPTPAITGARACSC